MLITLGSKGVLWVNESTSQLIKAIKVNAVDTTGAGDSFIGSFAHYYASGDDIPTAIKHANQYAAVTVTRRGTQKSYPTADELSLLVKTSTIFSENQKVSSQINRETTLFITHF